MLWTRRALVTASTPTDGRAQFGCAGCFGTPTGLTDSSAGSGSPPDPHEKQKFVPGSSAKHALPLRFGNVDTPSRVYVVQGETDSVWLMQRDRDALVLGMPQGAGLQGFWRDHWTALIPESVPEVWVAFDPDPAGHLARRHRPQPPRARVSNWSFSPPGVCTPLIR